MKQDQGGENDRLLSREELAIRWGVTTETLKRKQKQGILKALKLGSRAVRYRLSDILKIEEEAVCE